MNSQQEKEKKMKSNTKITIIKYGSMSAFIIGYVGLGEIYGNINVLLMLLFLVGFITTKDVLIMEKNIKDLEEHKRIAKEAIDAMKNLTENIDKGEPNAKDL